MNINWLSIISIVWFIFCWVGYGIYAKRRSHKVDCLASIMHSYRKEWAMQIINRENRTEDVLTIGALERTTSFFASSSLIILAALFTALGAAEKTMSLLESIAFTKTLSYLEWEIMIVGLIITFIYAFFKMSWSMRQYSFCVTMVSALPPTNMDVSFNKKNQLISPLAKTLSGAAYHFNCGLRAYYFSLAIFAWLISPWLFITATSLTVLELHRREFRSSALKNMLPEETEEKSQETLEEKSTEKTEEK